MNVEHDDKWLYGETKTDGPQISDNDCIDFAKSYHQHMKAKEKQAEDRLQSPVIGQECKICNYSFQGLVPCKCHMRVSADVFQAVVDKIKE